jgi:hypothetical protein
MQQEQPEKVAELLIQFLQKQSPKLDQKSTKIGMDFGRGTDLARHLFKDLWSD